MTNLFETYRRFSPFYTKPFQGCAREWPSPADPDAREKLRSIVCRYHAAWLDSRALEENTPHDAALPDRDLKKARWRELSELMQARPS